MCMYVCMTLTVEFVTPCSLGLDLPPKFIHFKHSTHVIQAVINQMKLIQIGTTNSKMLFPVKVLQHITVILYTFVVSLIKCI